MTTNDAMNSSRWAMSSEGRARGNSRARANASAVSQWKKDVQLQERQSAMAEYDAARRAQSENMARLKALRLARDAAAALCPAVPLPRKARRTRRTRPALR